MTLVLLDTNAYLRLAKRVRPLLGRKFGQKEYVLKVLKITEDEVRKSPRLTHNYPWFDNPEFESERVSTQIRLNINEKQNIDIAKGVFRQHVLDNIDNYKTPPSIADCFILAFGYTRPSIVVTDDLSMHLLANEFGLKRSVWHGYELLHKLLSAKLIDNQKVIEIYDALECNGDLPRSWREVKHTTFKKVYGKRPK